MKGSLVGLAIAGVLMVVPAAAAGDVWEPVQGTPPPSLGGGTTAPIQPERFKAYTLDDSALEDRLDAAPSARSLRAATTTLTLPAPDGELQRFAVTESPIMEAGLAAKHPEITTYSGRGIDDPAATIRADRTPIGFHASVRSPGGAWYVDPYYHLDDSVYITYYGRDVTENPHGRFVEQEIDEDTDPLSLQAVPQGPEVQLRTYRLALLSDPGYATYHGGPQNVTAAKVTLMNRVNQVYEDETAIRLLLIADNDRLNLDTQEQFSQPNGPCGANACFATPVVSCTGGTLTRTRTVIGLLVGASHFDIGHIGLGAGGGGVASLGVVGGGFKAQGCTGLTTPIGDLFAVDYVAHEMGHQFGGPHTFNGTQANCSGGNRSAASSVEPGSGSSIMAYAGICARDNLQPHSDPYWSQRSFQQITAFVTSDLPPASEVQTVSLRGFDADGERFRLRLGGAESREITRGTNATLQGITDAISGHEVQTVAPGAGPFTLGYLGAETGVITPGQNNTQLGILNAIAGGNEQQVVSLTGFSGLLQSFQVQIGGATSAPLGAGGLPVTNANVASAINAIPGFAGTVTSSGAGNAGFTLTFAGASAGIDVPPVEIVNCTGACVASVRQTANGGPRLATWPDGATVVVGPVTAAGFALSFGGTLQATDVAELTISDGTVTETYKGAPAMLPAGATVTVNAWGGGTALNDGGFQLTFGGSLANLNVDAVELLGADGFVGEVARGGPVDNQGHTVTATGNHAPVIETAPAFTIPTRTPFELTAAATDFDGDTLTYMWEQNDRGGTTGTALFDNNKANGPLFRQFGTAAEVTPEGTLQSPSPGLNAAGTDPTRVFPDLGQILANNTNAVTGTCPPAPTGNSLPPELRDCYSEFLPTAAYVGFLDGRTLNFRVTARDGHPGAGGIGSADTRLTVEPLAGPFLVTSHGTPETLRGGTTQAVSWDVAGTDLAPISASEVRISLSTDGGATYPHVLAAATPNDGAADVTLPNVAAAKARIKVAAVGNVFFDLSDADLVIQAAPEVVVTDPTVQYSDAVAPAVVVDAEDGDSLGSALTATATGLPAGLSLGELSTSEHGRRWTLAGNVTSAPGTYPGSVTVTDGDGEAVTRPLTVTVTPEDATVTYAGDTLSSGQVLLRARLKDAEDGAPGDLSLATVTFREGSKTLCAGLSCTVTLPNGTHTISVVVGGHYAGTTTATVRVAKPTRKVNAIGFLSHLSTVFAIENRYAEILYGKDGRAYRISAGAIESIGFSSDGRRAELRASADLWDITRILRPVRVARDLTLQIALGESGKGSLAFSLWEDDTLLHEQPEQTLAGGFVTIR